MRKVRFAHLSDTHLNREGKDSFLKADVLSNFDKVIRHLHGMKEKNDFVVITGDVVHEGEVEDYRFLKELLEKAQQELGAPVLLTLGNHDNRQNFFEGYLGVEAQEAYYASYNIKGLRVILLDSKVGEHAVNGRIGQKQLSWLKEQLQEPSELGTILAFHHPLFTGGFMMEGHCMEESGELFDAIRGTDVIGILTGHTHTTNQCIVETGALSATAASTAFAMEMNETEIQMVDRRAFNVGVVEDKKMHVSNIQLAEEKVIATFSMKDMETLTGGEFNQEEFVGKAKVS